jgi:hypothetical protein
LFLNVSRVGKETKICEVVGFEMSPSPIFIIYLTNLFLKIIYINYLFNRFVELFIITSSKATYKILIKKIKINKTNTDIIKSIYNF